MTPMITSPGKMQQKSHYQSLSHRTAHRFLKAMLLQSTDCERYAEMNERQNA
jgi:hypothetical protein